MNSETLTNNLQRLIKMQGDLSVSELARVTQIPQPTLHHILDGTTKKPRKKALESLAAYFAIPIPQLTGELPLITIPKVIKENLQITVVPIIEWEKIKTWPEKESELSNRQEIIIHRKIDKNSFALVMKDQSMEPLFQEKSILIFDTGRKPKDRDFALVYFQKNDAVIFSRLFIDGEECFIRQNLTDGNIQLIKLTLPADKIIATLIEARMQY